MSGRMLAGALHARTRAFRRRLEEAERVLGDALETNARWHVALSGGKDSTVVLDLIRRLDPDTPAVWSDDEWYLPETAAYMDRLRSGGVNLHPIRTNAWHAEWFQTSGDWDGVDDYARAQGWDGVLLGLRAEENRHRRVHLNAHGVLYQTRAGMWQCNPIAWWGWQDVWAYIESRGVDYNRAYDVLEAIGVPPERQRVGPFAVERALGYGQLTLLKRGWPDLWRRFAAAHPEARSYT